MHISRRFALASVSVLLGSSWRAASEATSTVQLVTSETPLSSTSPASTCAFTSLNYIIHTLPQQCFTSQWASQHPQSEGETAATPKPDSPSTPKVSSASPRESDGHIKRPDASSQHDSTLETPPTTSQHTVHPSVSSAVSDSKPPESSVEGDADSPLDNAKFLSFEDWKQKNLEKAGQSPEGLGSRVGGRDEQRRRPGPPNNALDFLGEDAEIEFDFGGFASQRPMDNAPPLKGSQVKDSRNQEDAVAPNEQISKDGGVRKRPKDAGRTCRERTNYASYDCAATTLKTNPECKGPSAILVENKDTYMLNICSAKNKFFIVELCDNILIDTIVLANFEFFSSMFRTFRVSVSDKYPVKAEKWREIGTCEGKNSREVQAFLVENPLIWARYIRVELLKHYGSEYYCPLSLFRVHGTTMMEEFNSEIKGSINDDDPEIEVVEGDDALKVESALKPTKETFIEDGSHTTERSSETQAAVSVGNVLSPVNTASPASTSYPTRTGAAILPSMKTDITGPRNSSLEVSPRRSFHVFEMPGTCPARDAPKATLGPSPSEPNETNGSMVSVIMSNITQTKRPSSGEAGTVSRTDPASSVTSSRNLESSSSDHGRISESSNRSSDKSSAVSSRTHSSSTQPPASNPTTQESFFKSVHKRLQLLEANSTLSLQYIEEQSRILREAFAVVERRQNVKTTTFLENLNKTVQTELLEFRQQYDQIWQSTVLELSSQRELSQREVFALSARLSLLADEVVFQKRMAILQFILILLCLGFAIFSRHSSSSHHLELRPFVQNALNRSSANLSKYAPHFESFSSSPSASRPSSRYGILHNLTHRRSPSRDVVNKIDDRSPSIEYSPPTPESQRSEIDNLDILDSSKQGFGDLNSASDPDGRIRSRSTPATPEVIKEERKAFLGESFPTP